MLFEFFTDVPGDAQGLRLSKTLSGTVGRVPVNIRLPGNTKGRQIKARISGAYIVRLFAARVFAKTLGTPTPTGWTWRALPVDVTPDLFASFSLPIPATASTFSEFKIPMEPSDTLFEWVTLPMDAIE